MLTDALKEIFGFDTELSWEYPYILEWDGTLESLGREEQEAAKRYLAQGLSMGQIAEAAKAEARNRLHG